MLRLLLLLAAVISPIASGQTAVPIEFSIIKTSEVTTREGMVFSGGRYSQPVKLNHVAILVRHPKGNFLFDSGLGSDIGKQFKADMPWWAAPFFSYGPVRTARSQLDAHGPVPIERIILSHGHWDHASALPDFPGAFVWVTEKERHYLRVPHRAAVFPSQVSAAATHWVTFQFDPKPFRSFASSADLFSDGSAVLVPLPGHTPGSVGMFITLQSGRQYFFVGDAIWKIDALAGKQPKMWLARKIVDDDEAQTLGAVAAIDRERLSNPGLVIIPAHDAQVHDTIGYFPKMNR
ncbi:MAG: MBL fold metallo-hydrolase [Pseudomonadota bacterium]